LHLLRALKEGGHKGKPTFKANAFNVEHYVYERVGCEYLDYSAAALRANMSSMSMPAVSTSPVSTREPNFAILMGVTWLLVVGQLMAENWAAMAVTLPDADDAMRLV
jgi:hypothetical protein